MACPLGLLDRSLGVQRLLVASAFEGLVPETADIRQSRRVTLTSLKQSGLLTHPVITIFPCTLFSCLKPTSI